MQRRHFIKLAFFGAWTSALLRPVRAAAARARAAFDARDWAEVLRLLFGGRAIEDSTAIDVRVQDLIEDGAVVPVEIRTTLSGVRAITILVEDNPNPCIAIFEPAPECRGPFATHIKMAGASDITVVAENGEGLYRARRHVEVALGGCS